MGGDEAKFAPIDFAPAYRLEETGDDDRRLARALTVEGEARFFFAEQKRKMLGNGS